jgi:hypothetical protein
MNGAGRTLSLLFLAAASMTACVGDDDQPIGGQPSDASSDGGIGGRIWVATSDAVTTSVATLDVTNQRVVSSASYADGDAVPVISDGRAFALERTNDVLHVLDADGATLRSISFHEDGGATKNPHDVVVVPGTSTAFVPLYNAGAIAVVDLAAGTVTSTIDLSSFADAADADHSPDVDSGIFVPSTGLIYFTLQRIDTTHFPIACPTVPSLIVAIDPATKALVAADAGPSPISLNFVSPSSVAYDAQGGRLIVLSNGCAVAGADGGSVRMHHGIEAISLSTGQSQTLYAPTSPDFLSSLIWLGPGSALVNSFDASFTNQWNRWDLTSPTLGTALANVPDGAVRETVDTLLGVSNSFAADGGQAGYDVVRYRIATDEVAPVVSNSSVPHYLFFNGVAYAP